MSSIEDAPPIVLNIWDMDAGLIDSKDYLGRSVIYLNEASSNLNEDGEDPDNDTINN